MFEMTGNVVVDQVFLRKANSDDEVWNEEAIRSFVVKFHGNQVKCVVC